MRVRSFVAKVRRNARRRWLIVAALVLLTTTHEIAANLASGLLPASWTSHRPLEVWVFLVAIVAVMIVVVAAGPTDAVDTVSPPQATGTASQECSRSGDVLPCEIAVGFGLPILSNLPGLDGVFMGREKLLADMRRRLCNGDRLALLGLGGVGKSWLALEFARQGQSRGLYEVIWWLRAGSHTTLIEDLTSLARALGLKSTLAERELADWIQERIRRRGKCLLIFDDVTDAATVQQWQPVSDGHILITCRDRDRAGSAQEIEVPVFTREESLTYLRRRAGQEKSSAKETPDDATSVAENALAEMVGDLPLALAQAADYVYRTAGPSLEGYVKLYRDSRSRGHLLARGIGQYPESVATTWLIQFRRLAALHPAAMQLLAIGCHLGSSQIPVKLLLSKPNILKGRMTGKLATASRFALLREETIQALAGTGLAQRIDDDHITIHPLVSEVTRYYLAGSFDRHKDRSSSARWIRHTVDILNHLFPDDPNETRTWPLCASLAPHVLAAASLGVEENVRTYQAGRAMRRLAIYQQTVGMYFEAEEDLRLAIINFKGAYRINHREIARTRLDRGHLYQRMGKPYLARQQEWLALATFLRAFPQDPLDIARALGRLGVIERELGNCITAEIYQREALVILEWMGEPGLLDTARTRVNLANTQHQAGNLDDSLDNMLKGLKILKAEYGPKHPLVANTLSNLSLVHRDLGKLRRASAEQRDARRIFESTLGKDHPDSVRSLISQGRLEWQSGNLAQARKTLKRAITASTKAYRYHHADVGRAFIMLGRVELDSGSSTQAQMSLSRALSILRDAYGSNHQDVASTAATLKELSRV
jgi:tetratricopeptide (TPR) repeat protein